MKVFNIIGAVVMMTAIVLSGCSVFDMPDLKTTADSGKGFVTINIQGSEARTAFPNMTALTYNASFLCTSDSSKTADPILITSGTPFQLEEGTWTINIEAKKDNVVVGNAVITDVLVSNVLFQVNNVLITPVKSGTGTVILKILYHHGDIDDLDTAKIFFGSDTTGIDIKDLEKEDDLYVFTKDAVTPGSYMIRTVLTLGLKSAGNAEAVHVYSGMTTELEWEFWETSLVETKTLVIDVPITYSGTIEDLDLELIDVHGTHIYTVHSHGTYRFSILVGENMNSFEGTLIITTGNGNDFEVNINSFSYGSGTHTLPAITIYTLTANVGTGGKLEVNGDEYDGVMDFLNGKEITLAATATGNGYTLDTFTVNGNPYTTPFSISGDTVVAVTFTPPASDPNLIWEWNKHIHTWAGVTANTVYENNPVNGKNIRSLGTTAGVPAVDGNIQITSSARFVIGSTSNTNTTGTLWDTNAQFDFYSDGRNIKVTIDAELSVAGSASFQVFINNNQSGAANTVLSTGNVGRLINSPYTALIGNTVGDRATFDGTLNVANIRASGGAAAESLKNAFIGIMPLANSGTIIIHSIKVEYVGEPLTAPNNIEIFRSGSAITTLSATEGDAAIQLVARLTPNATGTFTWASTNTGVATVNPAGLVTIVGKGDAVISVKHDQITALEATVALTVAEGSGGPSLNWTSNGYVTASNYTSHTKASITHNTASATAWEAVFSAGGGSWATNGALAGPDRAIPFYMAVDFGEEKLVNKVIHNFSGGQARLTNYYVAYTNDPAKWSALIRNSTNTVTAGSATPFTDIIGVGTGWTSFISRASSPSASNSFTVADFTGGVQVTGRYFIIIGETVNNSQGAITVTRVEFAYEE